MPSEFGTVIDLVVSPEFLHGLRVAGVVLVLGLLLLPVARRRGPLPVGGLGLAAAGAVALLGTPVAERAILAGLALLAAVGLVRLSNRAVGAAVGVVLALPGAWLAVNGLGPPSPEWLGWLAMVTIVAGGPLLAAADTVLPDPPVVPWMVAISAGAVLLTVPDTEEILMLVPIATAVALLGWPLRIARLGRAGALSWLGLLMVVILWDGRGRITSVVGASATLLVPLLAGAWAIARQRLEEPVARPWLIVAFSLVAALVAARVAGVSDSIGFAGAVTAATAVLAAALLRLTRAWR